MSKFDEFIGKIKGNKELQEKIRKIRVSAIEKIIKIAKEEGFELTPADFTKGELPEENLENIAAAGIIPDGHCCKVGYNPVV